MFKKPEGAWDCDVCCVQNKAADVACVACQTAKPGAAVAEPKGNDGEHPPVETGMWSPWFLSIVYQITSCSVIKMSHIFHVSALLFFVKLVFPKFLH